MNILVAKEQPINWSQPIWNREKPTRLWDPSRQLLKAIRKYQALRTSASPLGKLSKNWWVLVHRFWSVVTGAEISLSCNIGGGLLIPHPNGIVIHPNAVIGPNCLIFQQVTIAGACHIGSHVDIGAGAKILGPLVIGDNVRVGANSVVTKDVLANDVVAGVPARSLKTDRSNKGASLISPNQYIL